RGRPNVPGLRLPGGPVFVALERGAKHGRARGLAPVAAAGAIRSSEPLQSVRLVTRPRLTAMAGAERFCSRWTLAEYAPAAAVRQMEKVACVGFSPIQASGNDDDYDGSGDGAVVGRIMKANAAPVDEPWLWTVAFGHHEDRTPTHGYAATREATMAAFAKSWRRE